MNLYSFYLDTQTICGNVDIKELNAAPAPIVTNKAGKAQQRMVPVLVNKLKKDKFLILLNVLSSLFFFILLSDYISGFIHQWNFSDIIAWVYNDVFYFILTHTIIGTLKNNKTLI